MPRLRGGKAPSKATLVRAVCCVAHADCNPSESLAVARHSPDGFDWGDGGSGAAQLSLAILEVQSGRGRNPTPSPWAPGTAQDARRHGERHVCIGILHGAGHLGINQATHPPPVRQFGRPAAYAGLQDPPGPLTAVAARGWRPYGGINPSLGWKFGVQATVGKHQNPWVKGVDFNG